MWSITGFSTEKLSDNMIFSEKLIVFLPIMLSITKFFMDNITDNMFFFLLTKLTITRFYFKLPTIKISLENIID